MSDDAQNPAAETTLDRLEHLPRVEKVLVVLNKLIHGTKLYADNNPRLVQFRDEFELALARFFEIEEELTLTVDQYAISWWDHVVYKNDKRDESIAFLLYKDGVGEITVGPEAIPAETDAFVRILADEFHNSAPEEDVVTRFWNADFAHIRYRVLDDYLSADEDLSEAGGEVEPEIADQEELLPSLEDKGRVIVRPSDPLESIDGYLKKMILRTCPSDDEADREEYFQSMIGSFFEVGAEELEQYHAELERERHGDGLATFAEAVIVFTLLHDNPSAVRDVSGVLERIVDYCVEEKSPDTLARLLVLVREFAGTQNLPEPIDALCSRLDGKLTDAALIDEIAQSIVAWNSAAERALAYLGVVGEDAVDPLLRVLHGVEGKVLHENLCAALVRQVSGDVSSLIERLDTDVPSVALDAVEIARAAGLTKLTPRLHELLHYRDDAVKEAMIDLIGEIEDEETGDLLLEKVGDESKHIRIRALDATATRLTRYPRAAGAARIRGRIHEMAFGKDLERRDSDEQEAIFKALGRVGDAHTVERLARVVQKNADDPFGRSRESKFLIIRALELIVLPQSLQLLRSLCADGNALVQARARRALSGLEAKVLASGREEA